MNKKIKDKNADFDAENKMEAVPFSKKKRAAAHI